MQQPHLLCCSLTSKHTRHSLLAGSEHLKALVLSLFLFFGLQKRKRNLTCCFKVPKYISWTLLLATWPLRIPPVRGLMHFNFEKHHCTLLLGFNHWVPHLRHTLMFLNTEHMRGTLLLGLQRLKTSVNFFSNIFISKNNSGTLFGSFLP